MELHFILFFVFSPNQFSPHLDVLTLCISSPEAGISLLQFSEIVLSFVIFYYLSTLILSTFVSLAGYAD